MLRSALDDATLIEPVRLRERIELLDQLERLMCDGMIIDAALLDQTRALQARIEGANDQVYTSIRAGIRRGDRQALQQWLPDVNEASFDLGHPEAYDHLDTILAAVLRVDEPGPTSVERTSDMVFYQPTPARQVLDLIARVPMDADDVFMDLGSGLGHVPMLVSICAAVRCVGVEIEPAYVAAAQRAAESLKLRDVMSIEEDAQVASLESGTVFYMYTPFTGAMLRTVLDRLHEQARRRTICVCAFGSIVRTVAMESWLVATEPVRDGRVAVFRSQTPCS